MKRRAQLWRLMVPVALGIGTQIVVPGGAVADNEGATGPSPAKTASSAARMAPRGWVVLNQAKGDLNGDKLPDIAFILEKATKVENDYPPRCLVVALQGPNHLYNRAAFSWTQLEASGDGVVGDPGAEVTIKNGSLMVNQLVGSNDRCNSTMTFRRQPDGVFRLIGLTLLNYESSTGLGQERDENLLTGFVIVNPKPIAVEEGEEVSLQKFYDLRCAAAPVDDATALGKLNAWPTIPVRLVTKQCVKLGGPQWQGRNDLSATLDGTYSKTHLFVRATVKDQSVTPQDAVHLLSGDGKAIKPIASTRTPAPGGYVELQTYALKDLEPGETEGEGNERKLASIEVVDADKTGVHCVMSTADAAGAHSGEVFLTKQPLLQAL